MDKFYEMIRRIDDAIAHAIDYIENNDNVYEYLRESCPGWDEDMRKEFLILEYMENYYKD